MSIKFKYTNTARVYIPIGIKKNKSIEVIDARFRLGTGSVFSMISKNTLRDAGYDDIWLKNNAKEDDRYTLITADGRYAGSYYVQLPLINFVGFECENWPFGVAVDEDKDYRDLFGLDLQWGYNYILSGDKWHMEIVEFLDFEPNLRVSENQKVRRV